MAGTKNWLKRLNAPKHWYMDKLSGKYAPKPSSGPHKYRECLPLIVLLRNKLRYALTGAETQSICERRLVKVDAKVRTDKSFPAGFMDVVNLEKTGENFRLLYDTKGRFAIHGITPEESNYKLCRVRKMAVGSQKIPFVVTHDGRTIRYPDPLIKVNDTVKFDLTTGKIVDFTKFEVGNISMITAGRNIGRVGIITHIDRHFGGFDIIHCKDARDHEYATRIGNVFVIGKGNQPWVSLPKGDGIKLSQIEDRDNRLARQARIKAERNGTSLPDQENDEDSGMSEADE